MGRTEQTTRKLQPIGDVEIHAQWAFTRLDSILVLCTQGDREPPETDVDAWLVRVAQRDYTKILLHSRGGTPNAKQRSRLGAFWDKTHGPMPPCAVLTDSTLVRSVVVAVGWISSFRMRSFAEKDLAGALRYLEEPAALDAVSDAVATLHRALAARQSAR